jgi:hypothetical protein
VTCSTTNPDCSGVSGLSDDIKTLLESPRPEAAEAVELSDPAPNEKANQRRRNNDSAAHADLADESHHRLPGRELSHLTRIKWPNPLFGIFQFRRTLGR